MTSVWTPPAVLEEYAIHQKIGAGRMGQVYLAHDALLDRPVAIKFIAAQSASPALRQRFLTEARAAARLQHPNVAAIFRIGQVQERPYLVMEYVEGQPLSEVARPMDAEAAIDLVCGICAGLAAAHRRGVLHRDIKPANVICATDGTPKLVDFGLAKVFEASSSQPAATAPASFDEVTIDENVTIDVTADADPSDVSTYGNRTLTVQGAIIGTPDYMAPELWHQAVATRRSDVYAIGALFFELITRRTPFADVSPERLAQVVSQRAAPPVVGVPHALAETIARCLERQPEDRWGSADEVREAIERLRRKRSRRSGDANQNPYRGLHTFEERHQDLFFGRAADVEAVVERLRTDHIVVVAGDSGIGKSSLCRAGVLPALPHARLDGRTSWSQIALTPGLHPVRHLAHALAGFVGDDPDKVEKALFSDPTSVVAAVRYRNADRGLVILVDQLEELLVMSSPREAAAFEDWLASIASGYEGLRVLASARSDFLTGLVSLAQVGSAVAQGLYLLRPLISDQLRTIVVGPAEATGASFESEAFVDELVESVSEDHGTLPLLQFTLAKLWRVRDPKTGVIGRAALTALGGLTGALSQHADEVLASLRPQEQAEAREIFLQLVSSEGTRTLRTADKIRASDPGRARALETLVRGRLITALQRDGERAFQLAHEVLIRSWPTLQDWLAESDEQRRDQERLTRATRDWIRRGEPVDALWSSQRLREHAPSTSSQVSDDEYRFLKSSRRRARWLLARAVGIALALPGLAVGVYIGALQQNDRAVTDRVQTLLDEASDAARHAKSAEKNAIDLRTTMNRQLVQFQRPAAEKNWQRIRRLETVADSHRRTALGAIETAVMLRPDDVRLRDRFADELVDRLRLARRRRHVDLAEELRARLKVYDGNGRQSQRLNQPATIDIKTPDPIEIIVERYRDDNGVRTLHSLGRFSGVFTLAPGDYRLRIVASAFAPILWPLRLAAAEHRTIGLDRLQSRRVVPEPYIYIPAGTSYMGSKDEDSGRIDFFDAPPLHPVEVPAFAIARHEVTFAEYIAFLNDLDRETRQRYMPGTQGTGTGMMELRKHGKEWHLHFRPVTTDYIVHLGDSVVYPGRTRRKRQDWLRWPVLGVSAEQAQGYTQWLDRTQRLPGARLCTEHEWVRAARGADERAFPHGDRLEPEDANFDATYDRAPAGMGPDEVGQHPASRSPFGVDDLTGNAFEWTISSLDRDQFVLRGGSYFYDRKTNRICNRQVAGPTIRLASSGIRVCITL